MGQRSGLLGSAAVALRAALNVKPSIGVPGASLAAHGFGYGAGEQVTVWWDSPQQALGTTTTSGLGSFYGPLSITFTVPAGSAPGLHVLRGAGATTGATSLGQVTVP